MPYKKGYSKKSVSSNIKHFLRTGRSQAQAVAASLQIARTAKAKARRRKK